MRKSGEKNPDIFYADLGFFSLALTLRDRAFFSNFWISLRIFHEIWFVRVRGLIFVSVHNLMLIQMTK